MNHEHTATIDWQCQGAEFTSGKYSREHTWSFDGGLTVPASPSPSIVPAPWSNAALVDPEEAFVASIASCHMLWWLSHAARHGYDVETYRDVARGVMTRNERGKLWVSRVTLRPTFNTAGARPAATRRPTCMNSPMPIVSSPTPSGPRSSWNPLPHDVLSPIVRAAAYSRGRPHEVPAAPPASRRHALKMPAYNRCAHAYAFQPCD